MNRRTLPNTPQNGGLPAINKNWWRGAVIYQIYPRSFQDSNGDGIGDLQGIIEHIPYIASLGVDAFWVSPFFTSPMKDFGYDVSDYCDVDPIFGTLADFDEMISVAHANGLRVMIDLVLSHTSDKHAWFAESRKDKTNSKADWYVWADPKADGTAPNNWLSIFGGSAWQWDSRRLQYYLHNFLASQPDLNFHEPAVQKALLNVERFWLERGVDGFRLDTINFYFADKYLRDNPSLPAELRNSTIAPTVNPYNHQVHLYSKNQPENLAFLTKFRAVMDDYPAIAAVGEVGDAQFGLEILGEYTSGDDKLQMCYAFELLAKECPGAAKIVEIMQHLARVAPEGWACWAYSNHDVIRHPTRWNLTPAAARTYHVLLMCLRGSVIIYQGEELGFAEAEVPFAYLQDPYGIEFWPEFKGRDGCRTPMVWDNYKQNGGFSTTKPWLPVESSHLSKAAELQLDDPDSTVTQYRKSIALRKAYPALAVGSLEGLKATGNLLQFERSDQGQVIFCAFNLGDEPVTVDLPKGKWQSTDDDLSQNFSSDETEIHLEPWQFCLALKQDSSKG